MKTIYLGICLLFATSLCIGQNEWSLLQTFEKAPRDFEFVGPTGYLIENDGGITANGDILKTTDNGLSWSSIDDPDGGSGYLPKAIDLYFKTATEGYQITGNARASSTDLKLFKTTDGGDSWTYLSQLSTIEFFFGRMIQMSDTLSVVMGSASALAAPIIISTDNNQSWTTLNIPTSPFGKAADARFFSKNEGLVLREKGVEDAEILRTTDGGQTWQSVYTLDLPTGNIPAARPRRMYFPSRNVGYAITAFESINNDTTHTFAKTTDGGLTWTDLAPIPMTYEVNGQTITVDDWFLSEVYFLDENNGFVIGQDYSVSFGRIGFILRTNDGGMSWSMDIIPTNLHDAAKDSDGNAPEVLNIRWLESDRAFALYDQQLIRWGMGNGAMDIDNRFSTPTFQFYPNPAKNRLNLKVETATELSLRIFDTSGRQVTPSFQLNGETELDVSQLESGLYFILCRDAKGNSSSKSLQIVR